MAPKNRHRDGKNWAQFKPVGLKFGKWVEHRGAHARGHGEGSLPVGRHRRPGQPARGLREPQWRGRAGDGRRSATERARRWGQPDQGVNANATARAVRGSNHQNRKTGIYRAAARGESTFLWQRQLELTREPEHLRVKEVVAKQQLNRSRGEVVAGWEFLETIAGFQCLQDVAADIGRFMDRMPYVQTDRETVARQSEAKIREEIERVR
jgi:hypothetical protein